MPPTGRTSEFRKAYSQYYPLVFSDIYSRVGNREDAEDISHEVFIRFLDNFGGIDNHRGWLSTAARFEISNYYRKKANMKVDTVEIVDMENDASLSFVNGFRDARIILKEALENGENFKTEQDKTLFDLVAIHNFTFKEAGRYLGLTRWQAEYRYRETEKSIVQYLKSKGLREAGDLL